MSAATRRAISHAANTVDGITVAPYHQTVTRPGSGLVRLDHLTRDENGFGYVATWQVLILLPTDVLAAEQYLEAHLPDLLDALAEELVIATVTPGEYLAGDGTRIPCVVIEGHRETD